MLMLYASLVLVASVLLLVKPDLPQKISRWWHSPMEPDEMLGLFRTRNKTNDDIMSAWMRGKKDATVVMTTYEKLIADRTRVLKNLMKDPPEEP